MNILFNILGYKPAYQLGGPILSVSAVAEGLARRGHNVMVAATDSNNTERLEVDTEKWYDINDVKVRYFRMSDSWTKVIPSSYFRNSNGSYRANGIASWLFNTTTKFDVMHSHLPFVHGNRVLAAHAARTGTPYFYHQRGVFDPVRLNHRWIKKRIAIAMWEKGVCQKADALIALTEYERQSYRKLGLVNRVEVIPNGILVPDVAAHLWPFPDFPLSQEQPLVLFMSRLHRIKGPELAVEAFCRVRNSFPDARMIVAGPDDDAMTERLLRIVAQADAGEAVLLCGGLDGAMKAAVLARADVFILPTESEGFSMAILEGAANSCAVLTTPNAHFPEIATANAGIICDRTLGAIADGLSTLLSAPKRTRKMGESARSLVQERFTWAAVVDRLEALYVEVAAARAGRSGGVR